MAKTSGGSRNQKKSHPAPVQMALPGMAPVHGDNNNTLMRHLAGIEDNPGYFNRTTERVYVFNQDGSLDFTASQHAPSSVSLTDLQNSRLENKIVVHNHPSGSGFSQGDIGVTYAYNLLEMRATGSRGTYILRRPPGGWPSETTIRVALSQTRPFYWSDAGAWPRFAKAVGADFKFVPRQMY